VGGSVATNLVTQPTYASVSTELDSLITNLTAAYPSTPGRSGVVTQAACAALLGSASTLVQ
jgi:hypothetical protein